MREDLIKMLSEIKRAIKECNDEGILVEIEIMLEEVLSNIED